ncbi:MAG: YeeE/YedE thiosulfate transporter family protein, partial [Rubrivivax sp.]
WLDPVAIDLSRFGLKDQGLPALLAQASGLPARSAILAAALPLGAALLGFVFSNRRFRGNAVQVLGALTLGLLVVAGWALSGHIGYGENPDTLETVFFGTNSRTIESLSFVAPAAYTLELLMLWTDKSLHLSFGIATALGVVAGSFVYALVSRTFQWEGFASLSDLRNQLVGAVLMGFGGVTAMGCTVGQGMSGLSTLALGSFIAVAGIVAGAAATMKFMLWRED